jgi:hypothetical protein
MNPFLNRRVHTLAFAGLGCSLLAACAGMKSGPTGIVAPGASWEEISRAGRVFGEGVVAAKDGRLYMMRALPWALYRIKTVRRGHYFE